MLMAHILSHSTAKPQAAAKMTTGRTTKAKSSMTYPTLRHVLTPGADKRDLTHIKSMRILGARHKIRIRFVEAVARSRVAKRLLPLIETTSGSGRMSASAP